MSHAGLWPCHPQPHHITLRPVLQAVCHTRGHGVGHRLGQQQQVPRGGGLAAVRVPIQSLGLHAFVVQQLGQRLCDIRLGYART